MRRLLLSAVLLPALIGAAAAQNAPFSFIAWGDKPYAPDDGPKVDRLIAAMNAAKPAFTIHVGDIKSGSSSCADESLKKAFDQINSVEAPTVYSIGDNEWTDCHRERAGRFDPRERLAKVRELAFAKPGTTLGKTPMQVESQAVVMAPKFAKFVENQRFVKNGVMFVVPHIPGSNNGLEAADPKSAEEFFERNPANLAWIADSFKVAKETGLKAVVIAFQANPYDIRQVETAMPRASGFVATVSAIAKGARDLGRPVLVIHGDYHVFEMSNFMDTDMKPVPNTLRLQLFGEARAHAVKILVDPDSPGVFGFVPLIVPQNGAF
jgi:hypothetical protein